MILNIKPRFGSSKLAVMSHISKWQQPSLSGVRIIFSMIKIIFFYILKNLGWDVIRSNFFDNSASLPSSASTRLSTSGFWIELRKLNSDPSVPLGASKNPSDRRMPLSRSLSLALKLYLCILGRYLKLILNIKIQSIPLYDLQDLINHFSTSLH